MPRSNRNKNHRRYRYNPLHTGVAVRRVVHRPPRDHGDWCEYARQPRFRAPVQEREIIEYVPDSDYDYYHESDWGPCVREVRPYYEDTLRATDRYYTREVTREVGRNVNAREDRSLYCWDGGQDDDREPPSPMPYQYMTLDDPRSNIRSDPLSPSTSLGLVSNCAGTPVFHSVVYDGEDTVLHSRPGLVRTKPVAPQIMGDGLLAPHPYVFSSGRREVSVAPHVMGDGPFGSHPYCLLNGQQDIVTHVARSQQNAVVGPQVMFTASRNQPAIIPQSLLPGGKSCPDLHASIVPSPLGQSTPAPSTPRATNTATLTTVTSSPSEGGASDYSDADDDEKYWGGNKSDNPFLLSKVTFQADKAPDVFASIGRLHSDIRSVPLLVEVPRGGRAVADAFLKAKPSTKDRWKRMSEVYIIMPSRYQVGLAKTLTIPHGHMPLQELIPAMIDYAKLPAARKLKVHFIGYASNFQDENLIIRNDVDNIPLPWNEIADGLENLERPSSNADTTRQRNYVDVGYTGTRCVGRNARCNLGLSGPKMLVVSRGGGESQKFFEKTYQIDAALAECSEGMDLPTPSVGRTKRWAANLGVRNKKEAARLHESEWSPTSPSICSFHNDNQNGDISPVSFCNRVFIGPGGNWKRQGAVLYFRKSIDDYETRRKIQGPYLKKLRTFLEEDLRNRWEQSPATIARTDQFEIAEGLKAISLPCSCEVESYYQPFISSCNRLVQIFELDEEAMTSCLLAMAQSLCGAAYALAAVEVASAFRHRIKGDVGYAVMGIIRNLDKELEGSKKKKKKKLLNSPLRFSKYMTFSDESEREWLKRVRACLSAMQVARGVQKPTQEDYNDLHRTLMANLNGVGDLRANHLCGICAIMGLIPLSFFPMVDGGATKAYKEVKKKFGRDVPDKSIVLDNVHHLVEVVLQKGVTRRYSENTFCKTGRLLCGSDKRYHDIIDPRFPVFRVVGDKIHLFNSAGGETTLDSVFEILEGAVVPHVDCSTKKSRVKRWMHNMV